MANTVPIELTLQLEDIKNKLDELERHMHGWAFHIKEALAEVFTEKIFEGIEKGLELLKDSFKEWIAVAGEAESANVRMNAAVKAAGQQFGWTKEQVKEMAEALSTTSTVNFVDMEKAITKLTHILPDGTHLMDALEGAITLAAGAGEDFNEAVEKMGRALAYPDKAARALRGTLKDWQIDEVEAAAKAGESELARAKIIQYVAETYGEAAQDIKGTWEGMTATLRNLKHEAEIALGTGFLKLLEDIEPALETIMHRVVKIADAFREWFAAMLEGGSAKQGIEGIKDGMLKLFADIETFFARLPLNIKSVFGMLREEIGKIQQAVAALLMGFSFLPGGGQLLKAGTSLQSAGIKNEELGGAMSAQAEQKLSDRGTFDQERDKRLGELRSQASNDKRDAEEKKAELEKRAAVLKSIAAADAVFSAWDDAAKLTKEDLKKQEEDRKKADETAAKILERREQLDKQFGDMQERMKELVTKNNKEEVERRVGAMRFQSRIEDGGSVFNRIQTAAASIDPAKDTAANTKTIADEMKKLNQKINQNRGERKFIGVFG